MLWVRAEPGFPITRNYRLIAGIFVLVAVDRIVAWGRVFSSFGEYLSFSYNLMGILEMVSSIAIAFVSAGYAWGQSWVAKLEAGFSKHVFGPNNYVVETLFLLAALLLLTGIS